MRLRPSPAPHRLQPLPVGRGVSTRPRPSTTSCFHLMLPHHRPGLPPRRHANPRRSLTLWFSLPLAPLLSLPMAEHAHSRRRAPPRPRPSPSRPELSSSSATSLPTSSPSHVTGRAPKHHPDAFLLLGRRRSASPPRSLRCIPELAVRLVATAVSS